MTFAELKSKIDKLTPEQLACPVVWVGDERGGKVQYLWIADEDYLGTDGSDCVPRADLDPDDAECAHVIIPAGTPQLIVD